MGVMRRRKRFARQYSMLTPTQQWACDWRAFVLMRMRQKGAK